MLKNCKTIKHTIVIEYKCDTNDKTYTIKINSPHIYEGQYYEDWHYSAITFKCPHCEKRHTFEI